jgi:hypothetical protein
MKPITITITTAAVGLVLATLTLGCSEDPNLKVREVQAEHHEHLRDQEESRQKLDVEQQKARDTLALSQDKKDVELHKTETLGAIDYKKKIEAAGANVGAERLAYKSSSSARIAYVNVTATSLEARAAARKVPEPAIAAVRIRSAAVKSSLEKLDDVSDAGWFTNMERVDADLVVLEKEIQTLGASPSG